MTVGKVPSDIYEQLRQKAVALLGKSMDHPVPSPDGIPALLEELRIHQAELEIQNQELKRAQNDLSDLHQEYEDLYEFAPCGYMTLDHKGIITRINFAGVQFLGRAKQSILKSPFISYFERYWIDVYLSACRKSAETKEKQSIELPIKTEDGSPLWVKVDIQADLGASDEVVQWRAVLVDVTREKTLAEGLRIKALELEDRVCEKTAELAANHEEHKKLQAQLQQANKMEAIGTLAGGIAHDFNNLLMGIQGRTSILLISKDSSHPDFEHLKGIENYTESAADLTKQLLGFARGGRYEVKPTNLNELIQIEIQMFGRTRKEIRIHGKYAEDLGSVEIDRGQIGQVLLNLYVNAWQAMPGGGDLFIETENVTLDENHLKPFSANPGKYVKISIRDTGVGMDEATRERIFDPFFTTKEMGRGTGLGLASAYGIITNHGGLINVYSKKGHGSTFSIYLPASERVSVEAQEVSGGLLKGSETILLVDDEDMIIEVGKDLLEKIGYEVLTAKSGKEAIEIYEDNKERIDIVVLDMIMPDMSGGDAYDRIKRMDPKVKVLLSSGYSLNGSATEILDRGCNGFIQKPYKVKQLSQKLRDILDKE